jgi:hypothetical protein
MNLQEQIIKLKIKKSVQFSEIEMLSTVNDSVYARFGKTCAEITKLEKQLRRETINDLDEN